jgi:hypothetical protein
LPYVSYTNRWAQFNQNVLNLKTKNMTLNELGTKLSQMYNDAPKGDAVAMIHLFGIKYANEIKECDYSKKDIIEQSGISKSYLTELTKGVKLSEYVTPKN